MRVPIGAHIRRMNPRDAFGFEGRLIHRRRISRRGLPYGPAAPAGGQIDPTQIWTNGSRDRLYGVERQPLAPIRVRAAAMDLLRQRRASWQRKGPAYGHHGPERNTASRATAPRILLSSAQLAQLRQLRGGDYFFMPSITALGMFAMNLVDPR